MAKRSPASNSHTGLEEATRQLEIAMATAIQTQASFMPQIAQQRQQSDERFARIEASLAEVIRVLNEHTAILERLPEAVRDKIGFKGQP